MTLICHIAGPSGSGKTTLLHKLSQKYPSIITKDLDEFDDIASETLGLDSTHKKNWSENNFIDLKNERQKLMDAFLREHSKDNVVLAGFHTEDHHVLHIPTDNIFLLDVSALVSAQRAFDRSQHEKEEHRRKIEDMAYDIDQAEKDIDFLLSQGYIRKTEEEIMGFLAQYI